jgi:hypothetical protein
MTGPPQIVGVLTERNNRLLDAHDQPVTVDAVNGLSRTQREALAAIAFFRRQRKVGRGWLVGDTRVSEKLVERLEQMQLVEESFLGGEPRLQLTILGQAIREKLQ